MDQVSSVSGRHRVDPNHPSAVDLVCCGFRHQKRLESHHLAIAQKKWTVELPASGYRRRDIPATLIENDRVDPERPVSATNPTFAGHLRLRFPQAPIENMPWAGQDSLGARKLTADLPASYCRPGDFLAIVKGYNV